MRWLILFVGGGLGAMARFALALFVDERLPVPFPWGTLVVNAIGCFAIGLIASLADEHHMLSAGARLFIVAGLLGGFTTFSTFSLETWRLFEDGLGGLAMLSAAASLGACLIAVATGVVVARQLG